MENENAAVAALESAFGDAPPPKAPEPDDAPILPSARDAAEPEADPVDALPDEPEEQQAAPVADPEYEIEVDGSRHIVKGEQVKELLQKGMDYSQKSEYNARARDAIAAQVQQTAFAQQMQQAALADINELQAIDAKLDQYNKIDWNTAYEQDAFNALKLREQRDQLREIKAAKVQEFQAKQQQFRQGQAQASQAYIAAEQQALVAKLPEWRDSGKAQKEQGEIRTLLQNFGFTEAEMANVVDHRMVLVLRELNQLRSARKSADLKQVRTAPPVVKPGAVASSENGKAVFRKARDAVREYGRKGDHRAQEALVEKMLNRSFK